jgi:hypothetical protein
MSEPLEGRPIHPTLTKAFDPIAVIARAARELSDEVHVIRKERFCGSVIWKKSFCGCGKVTIADVAALGLLVAINLGCCRLSAAS